MATNALLDRIRKTSTLKDVDVVSQSKYFHKKDMIQTAIPALNIALSGELDGGFVPGLTLWCGPSKHFKSMFSLIMAKAYQDKYPDGIVIFYDCEFGTPLHYFDSLQLDKERILHCPIMNMEEFKFDCIQQLENLKRGDRVMFVIDSIGNMASKKEVDDAIEGKGVADMSRAKQLKSVFRMITPYLNRLDIPMVGVNHVYKEQGCLSINTKVLMDDLSYKPIGDIVVGDIVATRFGPKPVIDVYNNEFLLSVRPELEMYEIELDNGDIIRCTDNHRYLVNNEWVETKDLVVGSELTIN